jgi:uncharacterized membrane protein
VKVHFSNWIIVPLLLTGLVCLGLGIWVALLDGTPNMQIVIGAIISLGGVLYLVNPVFALEADSIALYRPIGVVSRRFPFRSCSEIRVDGNKLFVGQARVPIQKWYLNGSQWRAFEESIAR